MIHEPQFRRKGGSGREQFKVSFAGGEINAQVGKNSFGSFMVTRENVDPQDPTNLLGAFAQFSQTFFPLGWVCLPIAKYPPRITRNENQPMIAIIVRKVPRRFFAEFVGYFRQSQNKFCFQIIADPGNVWDMRNSFSLAVDFLIILFQGLGFFNFSGGPTGLFGNGFNGTGSFFGGGFFNRSFSFFARSDFLFLSRGFCRRGFF